jgi:hypothetical protein
LAGQLATAQDPWWLIGSAAVKLHGGDPGTIADVDVIVSRRDLDALYQRLPLTDTPDAGKPMFLSQRFGRWADPPLHVEFMAGLTLREDDEWHPVQPQTRQDFDIGGTIVFAPEREELIALLRRFGRDKDLARAASLQRD